MAVGTLRWFAPPVGITPRGIAFDNKFIYICDGGNTIQYSDIKGNQLKAIAYAAINISSIVLYGSVIISVDLANANINILDKKGNILKTISSPDIDPLSLASDGKSLYLGSNPNENEHQTDIKGNILRTIVSHGFGAGYTGKTKVKDIIQSNINVPNLERFDKNFNSMWSVISPGLNPQGFAFDGKSLYHAGGSDILIYQLAI